MKRLLVLTAALGVFAIGATVMATPAFACSSTPGDSCHGTIRWLPTLTWTGGLATLNATVLSVPNPDTDFSNHEMWIGTNNDPGTVLGPVVEEGMKYGEEGGVNQGLVI